MVHAPLSRPDARGGRANASSRCPHRVRWFENRDMKQFLIWSFGFWMSAIVLLAAPPRGSAQGGAKPRAQNPDAAATLVVFNENDRDSGELARFYAERRGVPKDQVIGLKCAKAEEISREEYDRTIAEPMRRAFTANFWWKLRDPESPTGAVESNKIRFVALMRGVPLKIAATANYSGDKVTGPAPVGGNNAAAVGFQMGILWRRPRPSFGG